MSNIQSVEELDSVLEKVKLLCLKLDLDVISLFRYLNTEYAVDVNSTKDDSAFDDLLEHIIDIEDTEDYIINMQDVYLGNNGEY